MLQLYFSAKIASFSSLFNLQSKSIKISVIFGQNTKAIALLFGQNCLIFITFQSAIKINQFQFRFLLGKIPRLQPYFLAKIASFSSLFNLQSKSINFNFGHLWAKYQGYSLTVWPKLPHFHHFSICNHNQSISISVICGQNTKAIALLFRQNCLIFITFQSAIKINQFQFRFFLGKIPRLQLYFSAKIASFSSLFNLQSKSINFNFGHFWAKYQGYSLTFSPKLPHFRHVSICNQNQSISISVIFGQNTKAIALLFRHNCLIFITFQLQSKSINFNFGHLWAKYQGYSLTVWPKLPHFHHFSICNHNQSISISVICGQNTKAIALLFRQNCLIVITFQSAIKINQFQFRSFLGKIPRLQPYFLAKLASFSSLFNLQSKSINFNFGHFLAKYQGYSLTFWPKLPHFHHFSICNHNQSISISVIFGQNTKAIALLFRQNCLIFITFQSAIKINQFQFRSFFGKIPRLQPYFFAKIASFSSRFNLQSKSINFNFGHFWAKYQGYSLTFSPQLPHFHHFSICNQNQSISISVICGQNTKAIALLFGQNCLIFITSQSAITINQFQFRSFVGKIIALLFRQNCLIVITFQSAIKINQFQFRSFLGKIPRLQPYFLAKLASFSSLFNLQSKSINFNFGHFWAKYQGYSLTFWPNLPHFHHFSICNQNQSISISVIFWQNTKAIALLFGQNCLIFITFQSAITINQFQFRSFLGKIPRLQPYFFAKIASFSSLFNLQSKSINFNFGHCLAKYQGYSLTFSPKLPHFRHVSICNQNQSISISVMCGQNTKAIVTKRRLIASLHRLRNDVITISKLNRNCWCNNCIRNPQEEPDWTIYC